MPSSNQQKHISSSLTMILRNQSTLHIATTPLKWTILSKNSQISDVKLCYLPLLICCSYLLQINTSKHKVQMIVRNEKLKPPPFWSVRSCASQQTFKNIRQQLSLYFYSQYSYKMSNLSNSDIHPLPEPAEPQLTKKPRNQTTNRKKKTPPCDPEDVPSTPSKTLPAKIPQRQMLLTKYCMKKHSSSGNETTNSNSVEDYITNPANQRFQLLEEELKRRDEVIEKLQKDREKEQAKGNRMQFQFLELTMKTKRAIVEAKKELALIQRRERATVNARYGFYKDSNCNSFVEGTYLLDIRKEITAIEAEIDSAEKERSKAKDENRNNLLGKIEFYRKSLREMKAELEVREREVTQYKERLRLAFKQTNSLFYKQDWPLLKNRYQPLQMIGSGGFGQVYRGYDIEKNQNIAIKINILEGKLSHEAMQNLMKHLKREMSIHKQLQHPNIVKMIDQLEMQGSKIGFILQYCTGPQLKTYLRKEGCLDERQAKNITKQLIYAIKYLHEQKYKIVHYDLKPANIMFHEGIVKIVDFGISKTMETEETKIDLTSPGIGTYWYLPPEVFDEKNAKVSSKVDIWSIGVIFFEMLYGKKPFGHGFSQSKILSQGTILNAFKVDFPAQSPKRYRISQQAKQLIAACLRYNPDNRLSPLQAYNHDYLK